MTDYTRSTGSSATMMIRDTGTTIEFWITAGNPTTWTDHLPWSGTVNGVSVGGSYNYQPNVGWRRLGVWGVSTNQNVTFSIGNSGTSGFGGPTTLGPQFILRATVPPAPNPVVLTAITSTQMHANFSGNGDGGSSIFIWQIGYGTSPDAPTSFIDTYDSDVTGLSAGVTYYFWARGQNAQGYGPWSVRSQATTLRAPDAPSSPTMSNITQVSATASFTANFDGGSPITDYRVGWSLTDDAPTDTTTFQAGSPINLTDLDPGEKYYFFTQARNAIGDSVWSAPTMAMMIAGAYVTVIEGGLPVVKRAVPYVRVSGVWKVARSIGRIAGVWKETI